MAHYIMIYDWMLELGLRGVEINAFAAIFSFWKKGKTYTGSASGLAKWMGVTSRNTVGAALSSLVKKGLVEKKERWEKGEKYCDYTCTAAVSKIAQGCAENEQGACSNIEQHNTIPDNNIHNTMIKEIKNKESCVLLTPDAWMRMHHG